MPPLKRFPLELAGIGAGGQKTKMMAIPDGQKMLKIGFNRLDASTCDRQAGREQDIFRRQRPRYHSVAGVK